MLSLLLISFCLLLEGIKSQTNCELGSFELEDLSRSIWWKIPITNELGCIFATESGTFVASSCDMYFSICHSLTGISGCNTNDGACQKGDFDGKAKQADIAVYRPINESGSILTSKTLLGFEVVYTGETAQAPCNTNILTLQFVCSSQAKWDSNAESGSTVPNGADTQSFIIDHQNSTCKYHYSFFYSGACHTAPTIGPLKCSVDHYDYKQLSSNSYWEVAGITSLQLCYRSQQCIVYFRLCEELPASSVNCGSNTGVCITDTQGAYYNLGKYNSTIQDLFSRADGMGFYAVYTEGDPAFLSCNVGNQITTTLNFICNKSAIWGTDTNKNFGQQPFNATFDQTNCTISYSFHYDGACIETTNAVEINVPWFGIIVIILIFFFLMYWVVGFSITIAMGKRGEDMIPNREFWYGGFKLFVGGFTFLYRLAIGKKTSEVELEGEKEPIVNPKDYQTIDTGKSGNNQKYPFGP